MMPANSVACQGAAAGVPAEMLLAGSCRATAAPAAAAWLLPPTASDSHGKALRPTWQQSALSCLQVCTCWLPIALPVTADCCHSQPVTHAFDFQPWVDTAAHLQYGFLLISVMIL